MSPPGSNRVGPLHDDAVADAIEVLARAFRDNPLNVAAVGGTPERRLGSNRAGTRGLVEVAQRHQAVWTVCEGARLAGALIGTPPGEYPLPAAPLRERMRALRVQGFRVARRWAQVFRALERLHPLEPHWYLGTLGVDPDAQGRGLGGTLLRQWLAHADATGASVYLETDRERNLRFYGRAGFSVVQRTEIFGVPVWCMQRPSAASTKHRLD
ncbi:MAG: GNAT family N-acetyltransferase [Myxococcota bacterium]|nr:GNAT family N-acetyltransferase [Myxococcota bacterium]